MNCKYFCVPDLPASKKKKKINSAQHLYFEIFPSKPILKILRIF